MTSSKSMPSGHAEQAALVQWFARQYPKTGHLLKGYDEVAQSDGRAAANTRLRQYVQKVISL